MFQIEKFGVSIEIMSAQNDVRLTPPRTGGRKNHQGARFPG
jgi:hypothetical protein